MITAQNMVKQMTHASLDPPPALEVRGLRVSYGAQPVLEDVAFALPAGQLVGIIGPNGAGKTTMLKAILGLVPITAGTIAAGGGILTQGRAAIARRGGHVA
ncbi:MAG: ATP-binding cassette domain-containing protein, partial [Roseiflexaceae bacterium]